MKKFDLKNAAIAVISMIGIAFLFIAIAIVYGICALYTFDSGLPGAIALAIIMVWMAYYSAGILHRWMVDRLREMDLGAEKEDR